MDDYDEYKKQMWPVVGAVRSIFKSLGGEPSIIQDSLMSGRPDLFGFYILYQSTSLILINRAFQLGLEFLIERFS